MLLHIPAIAHAAGLQPPGVKDWIAVKSAEVDQLKDFHRTTSPLYVVQLGDLFVQRHAAEKVFDPLTHRKGRVLVGRALRNAE